MTQCLVTKLTGAVDNLQLRKIGETQLLIPQGKTATLNCKNSVICTAIQGEFADGTTVKSGLYPALVAPENADVIVSVNNKYAIMNISGVSSVRIMVLDERIFDYYGSADGVTPYQMLANMVIDANNRAFGRIPNLQQIGSASSTTTLINFDWESQYNGLDSEHLPALTKFGLLPNREVDIEVLGRLTNVTAFYFRPTQNWKGEIRNLCDAFIANGKNDTFTILANSSKLMLDGALVAYDKTVTCTYNNGTYECAVS